MKKFWILTTVIFVVILTTVIIGINKYMPESKAEEKNEKMIEITFSAGGKNNAFNDVHQTLKANTINGYVTFPDTFKDIVSSPVLVIFNTAYLP